MDCQKVRDRTRELREKISVLDGVRRVMAEHCEMLLVELDTIPEIMEEVQALERKRDDLKREIRALDHSLYVQRAAIADAAREVLHGPADLSLMRRRLGNLVDVLVFSNGNFNPDTLRMKVLR